MFKVLPSSFVDSLRGQNFTLEQVMQKVLKRRAEIDTFFQSDQNSGNSTSDEDSDLGVVSELIKLKVRKENRFEIA